MECDNILTNQKIECCESLKTYNYKIVGKYLYRDNKKYALITESFKRCYENHQTITAKVISKNKYLDGQEISITLFFKN